MSDVDQDAEAEAHVMVERQRHLKRGVAAGCKAYWADSARQARADDHSMKKAGLQYVDAQAAFGAMAIRDERIALYVLEHCDSEQINKEDHVSRSLLHVAVAKSLWYATHTILRRNDFELHDDKDHLGRTALHVAAEAGHEVFCQLLLDNPKFTAANETDMKGWTALHYASACGHVEVLNLLLEHPAYQAIDDEDELGYTPIHCADGQHSSAFTTLYFNPKYTAVYDPEDTTVPSRIDAKWKHIARHHAMMNKNQATKKSPSSPDTPTQAGSPKGSLQLAGSTMTRGPSAISLVADKAPVVY